MFSALVSMEYWIDIERSINNIDTYNLRIKKNKLWYLVIYINLHFYHKKLERSINILTFNKKKTKSRSYLLPICK